MSLSPNRSMQAELGAVRVLEAIVLLDHRPGRQRPALLGHPRHVAAKLDLLREQRLAGLAVGRAFAGERRLGLLRELGGGCQVGVHHLLPVFLPSHNGAERDRVAAGLAVVATEARLANVSRAGPR